MENKELTPSESLELITKVILEAKSRFHDTGFSFIFLGAVICLASLAQFVLIKMGYGSICYYPYFLMPIAAVITYFYYHNKLKNVPKTHNPISMVLRFLGLIIGINTMVIGFAFANKFGLSLFPVMLILVALWSMISGLAIKFKAIFITGFLINIIGFAVFFIPLLYHPLILSAVSLIGLVLPGIILNYTNRNSHV
jgi:hypothetical protein